MIIWLNGGFGAGKSTLARQLQRCIPGAVVFDPEDVGFMLWKWLDPNEDFQDLASWRELVIATAVSLRKHHAETLIVPMSLIRADYQREVLTGLTQAGEQVFNVFLEVDREVLRERLRARAISEGIGESAPQWGVARIDLAEDAALRQPPGTLMMRADLLSPAELASRVLTALSDPRL